MRHAARRCEDKPALVQATIRALQRGYTQTQNDPESAVSTMLDARAGPRPRGARRRSSTPSRRRSPPARPRSASCGRRCCASGRRGTRVRDPQRADRRPPGVRHHARREAEKRLVSLGRCPSRRQSSWSAPARPASRSATSSTGSAWSTSCSSAAASAQRWRDRWEVVLPGDAELERAAAGRALRRRRPRRLHAPRRGRRAPRALRRGLRSAAARGRRGRARCGAAPRGGFGSRPPTGELPRGTVVVCHRRLPAAAPAADRGRAAARPGAARHRRTTAPGDLPPGPVLVVGSGQSGCQIAEELREAGREVFLACGKAAWAPRRIGDRDLIWWAARDGLPRPAVRRAAGPGARGSPATSLATGHGGGHDLHLRTLHALGVHAARPPRAAPPGRHARFAPDLARERRVGRRAHAPASSASCAGSWRTAGCAEPDLPEPEPLDVERARASSTSRGFGAVDRHRAASAPTTTSWVDVPGAFDAFGFPLHDGRALAPPRRACGSPACTSCASASRRCSSASARTPRSSPTGSPRRRASPRPARPRSRRGSRARGRPAGARPRSRPTPPPSAGRRRGRPA